MEHPFKRRRIERRVARSLGTARVTDHVHTHGKVAKTEVDLAITIPKLVLPTELSTVQDHTKDHLSTPLPKPSRLELRQLLSSPVADPVQNANNDIVQPANESAANGVNNLTQPVTSPAAEAVQNTVNNASNAVNNVAQPAAQSANNAVNNGVQPVAQGAGTAVNSGLAPVGAAASQLSSDVSAASPTSPTLPPSQPVDDQPGLVSPLPAVAAENARQEALRNQEAAREQGGGNVPSSGEATPTLPSAAQPSLAIMNMPSSSGLGQMSIQVPGTSSQQPLSEPSTPLPPSPESTTSPTYFPSSPPMTTNPPQPSSGLNTISNSRPAASRNSTLPAMSTTNGITSSSQASLPTILFTSQASQASASSLSMLSMLSISSRAQVSTTLLSANTSQMSTTTSMPTLTPSTFLTMTASSSGSSQASSTAAQSSAAAPSTGVGGGIFGGTATSSSPPAATTSSGSGSGGGSSMPPTKDLVGGIIGGVAGVVLIIAALLFLYRWRRGKVGQRRSISPPVPQMAGAGSAALGGAMTQRSSTRSNVPIATAGLFGRLRPSSAQTATTTDTAPSERGFQKISGRKLPSVLHSGGDGYGNTPAAQAGPSAGSGAKAVAPGQGPFAGLAPPMRPPSPQRSLSGSSFYRDSHGFYGGVVPADSASSPTDPSSSPMSSSPTFPAPPSAGAPFAGAGKSPGMSSPGVPNIRPGPARQPIIQQGGVVPMRTPSRGQQQRQRPAPSPISEDPLGRSHPSQDGSRQSRFRESTTPP
ncbi:MAG: hypothetical protein OHK93_006165 [Ramalina farinacea]|uniref:Uncharacterized protein n=1 Tax=Ramalina farinacea TaxID=258253 RepID=A0AA43TSS2_9LECA|nr:hypothetical protein [Ramalina farinacea]